MVGRRTARPSVSGQMVNCSSHSWLGRPERDGPTGLSVRTLLPARETGTLNAGRTLAPETARAPIAQLDRATPS